MIRNFATSHSWCVRTPIGSWEEVGCHWLRQCILCKAFDFCCTGEAPVHTQFTIDLPVH